jgi:hypothetical protein
MDMQPFRTTFALQPTEYVGLVWQEMPFAIPNGYYDVT